MWNKVEEALKSILTQDPDVYVRTGAGKFVQRKYDNECKAVKNDNPNHPAEVCIWGNGYRKML